MCEISQILEMHPDILGWEMCETSQILEMPTNK
jgi:hypothetical protein